MLTTRTYLLAAALALVALGPSASVAQIVPVSQTRIVTAETTHPFGTPDFESAQAPDFGPSRTRARRRLAISTVPATATATAPTAASPYRRERAAT